MGWPRGEASVDLQTLCEIAEGLNVRHDCGEPVRAKVQPKSSGKGYRVTCNFGPKRRALQVLCREVLRARWGVSKFEYAQRGRGRDRAV